MRKIILFLLSLLFFCGCSSRIETIKVEYISQKQKNIGDYATANLQKASDFYNVQKFDSALIYCELSYEQENENWQLYFLLGQLEFNSEQFKKANTNYYHALSLCKSENSKRAKIYFALAENTNKLGNLKSSKQHFLMVIQLFPNSELSKRAAIKMQLLSSLQ